MKNLVLYSIFSLGAFALGAQADPIGMIGKVNGKVTLNGDVTPARLRGRLEPGTVVKVGPNSSAVVVLFDNSLRYEIKANSKATVNASNVVGGSKVGDLKAPSSKAVKLLGNARVGAYLARPPATFQRLLDNSPEYLLNPNPHFEWRAEPDAIRYSFTLFDANDNVAWWTSTDQTGVDYPANLPPLLEKRPYTWKLTAYRKSGKPSDRSRFGVVTILSTADEQSLNGLVEDIKNEIADNEKNKVEDTLPFVVLAETYLSFGLVNSALETYEGEGFKNEANAREARDEILDSMSPFFRVMKGRRVESVNSQAVDAPAIDASTL